MKMLILKVILFLGITLFGILAITFPLKAFASEIEMEMIVDDTYYQDKIQYSSEWTSRGEAIRSYDVSDQGWVAIAFTKNKIGIFDENMNFISELSFETSGVYGVLWYGESILIMDNTPHRAIECNIYGEIIRVFDVKGPDTYWFDIVEKRMRKWEGWRYYCMNKRMNSDSVHSTYYIALERKSKDGKKEILYKSDRKLDAGESGILIAGGCYLFVILAFVSSILYAWKAPTKTKEKQN